MPKTPQTPVSVLQSLLEEYQITQSALANAIGLSTSTIRQIFMGKSKITVPTAMRLARFFGQTADYWLDLQRAVDKHEAENDNELKAALKSIPKAKKPKESKVKPESKPKTTLAEKRKEASKVPGAKPASRGRKSNRRTSETTPVGTNDE